MSETSGFFDAVYDEETGDYDLKYLAEQFAAYFSNFIGNGVFISPTNQLKVHAGEGLTVTVEPGWAFIDGYWYWNDEQKVLVVPPNATSQIRTDCVKCRLDYANRKIHVLYFNGTTDIDRGGNYYDLKLAEVIVPAVATQIIEANITDTRQNEEVCGFVKSLLEVVETDDLFAQYNAMFNNWFDSIKGSLGEDPATSLQSQIGFLEDLQTEVKTDIVSATNWLNNNSVSVIPDTSTDTVVSLFNAMPKNSTRRYFSSGGLSDFPDSEKSIGYHLLEMYKADSVEDAYSRILLINNATGTLYSGRCDGATVVWTKYVRSSDLEYKNITDKFTADTSKIVIGAYAENGSVFITTRVREGVTGTISAQLNDLAYAPRTYVAGTYSSISSAADKGKFVGAGLSTEGVLTVWLDSALAVGENVTFTYPLKTES